MKSSTLVFGPKIVDEHIKFSAVVPAYNRAATINRAVDSILSQEYPAAEIIVVDDGSVDKTSKMLERYAAKVRCIYQTNAGVAAARNRGVQEATNEWVAFLDSDDYWLPQHLKRMATAIEATKGRAALYFSDLQSLAQEHAIRHWERCGLQVTAPYQFKEDAAEWAFMRIQPMMLQASVIRRQCYLDCGGLPQQMRVREDTLLFYKLSLSYPACAVPECGLHQTDDAPVRLTAQMDEFSIQYSLDTLTMFKDILALGAALRPEHHKRVVEGLSAAHFSAARAFYRRGIYMTSLRHLLLSAAVSSRAFAERLAQSLSRAARGRKNMNSSTTLARL